jgi:acetyltransferase
MKEYAYDSSLNILYRKQRQLDSIFAPKSVAVIGATERENSVGRTILWNLLRSPFGGRLYPVNPKRKEVLGLPAYPSVLDIPEKIDLAVIVTPAQTVPEVIAECVEGNIPSAIIISAGFRELGEPGILLENEIMKHAKRGKMRIIGPNCLGVMNPLTGLNATFAADMALKGNVAFISQSGALCTAVLDWSLKEKVGFSSFLSIGTMMDVNWGDLITYLGSDPNTHSILIYMESVGDPRSFLSAAREVALSKPIILIKAGITEESAKAATSHTGSMAGSNEVLNAALRRVGVLRVDTISDLFSMAEILSKQPRPKGPHLSIITNAGGPGVIATDALIQSGGKLATLTPQVIETFNRFLPKEWSHNNPIDILGDASPDLYAKALDVAIQDPSTDGILVILTPQYMTHPTKTAERLKPYAKSADKPILTSWMGGSSVAEGARLLIDYEIPCFEFPDVACKTFGYMWSHSDNLKALYQTPTLYEEENERLKEEKRQQEIQKIFDELRNEQRSLLTEYEAKKVLQAYGIPTAVTEIAKTQKEAVLWAEKMGFPVVLKLFSQTITHKSDVGGVKLNLNNQEAVERAYVEIFESVKKILGEIHFQGVTVQPMIPIDSGSYELILGSSVDPEFGPVLLFGTGGQLVEVFKDSALSLPPLNSTLAKRMMERTKIYEALKGVRGRKAVALAELERVLVRFSNLISEHPEIKECDINPLLVNPHQIIALDARILLHEGTHRSTLAIRPYPIQYVQEWKLKDQTPVIIRPIRPEDEPLMIDFFKDLSKRTVFQRFLQEMNYDQLVAKERLIRLCFTDYDREIALVFEHKSKEGKKEILALGRLTKLALSDEASFALLVKDSWQRKGIGFRLLQLLIEIAKNEGVKKIIASMCPENEEMRKICEKMGFALSFDEETKRIFADLSL